MGKDHTILVVDDEQDIRDVLARILGEKYSVITASNGIEGFQLAAEARPHAIILDLIMPKMDGIQTCQALRNCAATRDIPVIILTALRSSEDRVRAFRNGADDYIDKPFYPDELMVRLETKLKRHYQDRSADIGAILNCGNLSLKLDSYQAFLESKEVTLTMNEFKLVRYLVENKGTLCTRDEIIQSVWGNLEKSGRVLDSYVLAIRRKLKGFDHQICSIYRGGYLLKASAELERDSAQTAFA